MLPDRVSNPGPLTYESGAPPIALRGPAPEVLFRGSSDPRFLNLGIKSFTELIRKLQ